MRAEWVFLALAAAAAACDVAHAKHHCGGPLLATSAVNNGSVGDILIRELVMRDGVALHSVIVTPELDLAKNKTFTTVIDSSPYGPVYMELIADIFLPFDFASLGQDMRGTCNSDGNFSLWRSSYNDTQDTIQWIQQQPWSNGIVYTVGASADGIAALVLAAGPPLKNLEKQFIIFATAQPYDDVFPGGAYLESLIDGWLHGTVPDQYSWLDPEVKTHEAPGDPWWDVVTPQWSNVRSPAVFWSGWFDIFLNGNLAAFNGYQFYTADDVRNRSWLVVDAMGHCQDAHTQFPHEGIFEGRSALPVLLGIAHFVGDLEKNPPLIPEDVKAVTWFVMGANYSGAPGNFWTSQDYFPTAQLVPYYFVTGGKLQRGIPDTSSNGSSTFVYDPTNPVPSHGGNNLEIKCGPLDQSDVEKRPDVLVFSSEILDLPLALTGNLTAQIWVSSADVNDTDWTVKLSDVYPDGTSHIIQDGIVRMRWRKGGSVSVPISRNAIEKIDVSLWATSHIFNKGHRLRVSVSSSNYPRFSVNPNNGLPMSVNGTLVNATNTLQHNAFYPSHITLPIVKVEQLPRHNVLDSVNKILAALPSHIDKDKLLRDAEALGSFIMNSGRSSN